MSDNPNNNPEPKLPPLTAEQLEAIAAGEAARRIEAINTLGVTAAEGVFNFGGRQNKATR